MSKKLMVLAAGGALVAAALVAREAAVATPVHAQAAAPKVYEMRTYVVPEDKIDALHTRFRDHTLRMFQKHGITNVIYLKPQDPEKAKTTIVYLIAHPSREAAKQNWSAFGKDPEWQKIAADSGVGRVQIVSEFFDPTDYSPMK
jgi:hypothetical protein